jgi:hypothetical protein
MPATATAQATSRYDIDGFLKLIGDVPVTTDLQRVRLRSRDYFWYSPVLNKQLHGKSADIVVTPRNEADVIAVAAACAKLRIPLTPRGAATGNYGQAVPLEGGVLLDLTAMTRIEWQKPGLVRCEPGIKMNDLDAATRPNGWEIRMHPSTKRMATIGGFVGGGSGGIGSINYGGLREPGNILCARVVTLEEQPRVIELRTDAAQKVNRAYGTTGIITALEMPLSPAWPWVDLIVTFDDFMEAMQVGYDVALADGVVKKLITPMIWPIPQHFPALKKHCPEGKHVIFCMIAKPSLESFKQIVGARGTITFEQPHDDSQGKEPLYLEPHDSAVAEAGSLDHLPAVPLSARPGDRVGEADDGDVSRRGAAAHRVHPLCWPHHLLGTADRALHHRGAPERDHRAARAE